MSFTTHPSTPKLRVVIDGVPVGALKSFCEKCVQDLTLMRGLGSSENLVYNRNGMQFVVDLQYVLPLGCSFVDAPADPASLQSFTLSIQLPNRTLRFSECVYESVQTSCEVGGELLCTMRIFARRRECINETG